MYDIRFKCFYNKARGTRGPWYNERETIVIRIDNIILGQGTVAESMLNRYQIAQLGTSDQSNLVIVSYRNLCVVFNLIKQT